MEFRAYRFFGESIATREHSDGGVFACVLIPEYGTDVITSFILKLLSTSGALVPLHSTKQTVLFSVFATKWAGF